MSQSLCKMIKVWLDTFDLQFTSLVAYSVLFCSVQTRLTRSRFTMVRGTDPSLVQRNE